VVNLMGVDLSFFCKEKISFYIQRKEKMPFIFKEEYKTHSSGAKEHITYIE
jgi:hypothetical protein